MSVVLNSSSIFSTYISTVDHLPCDFVRSLWLVQSCNVAIDHEKEHLHQLLQQDNAASVTEQYVRSQTKLRHLHDESVAEMDALCTQLLSHEAMLKSEISQLQRVADTPIAQDTSSSEKLRAQLREHYKQNPLPSQVEALQDQERGNGNEKKLPGRTSGLKIILKLSKSRRDPEVKVTKATRVSNVHKAQKQTIKKKKEVVNIPEPAFQAAQAPEEDRNLYCFCKQRSFGDMIACDNETCPNGEWFHYKCVGLLNRVEALKYTAEKWYCSPKCREIVTAKPAPKKGRPKGKKKKTKW